MKNSRIKIMSMAAGTAGMLAVAFGAMAQSQLGAGSVILGLVAVAIAAKTLVDTRKMEREFNAE